MKGKFFFSVAVLGSMVAFFFAQHATGKKRSDFLYLIFDCAPDYGYTVYVDGREVKAPYKVKLYRKVPRAFEIKTDEGIFYVGSIEAISEGDRTGKTFGYATCITPDIISRIKGETRIYVKNNSGKAVVKIVLKKPRKGALSPE